MPKGENLLRVMHYLAFLGYKVIELDRIDPDIQRLGQMIVLGVCTTDDLVNAMGYAGVTASERRSDLYHVLLRGGGATAARAKLMQAFVEERKVTLESALIEFEEKRPRLQHQQIASVQRTPRGINSSEKVARRQETGQTRPQHTQPTKDVQVSIAAGLVQSLLRHVQQLANKNREQLDAFRKNAPEIRELGEYLLAIASDTI